MKYHFGRPTKDSFSFNYPYTAKRAADIIYKCGFFPNDVGLAVTFFDMSMHYILSKNTIFIPIEYIDLHNNYIQHETNITSCFFKNKSVSKQFEEKDNWFESFLRHELVHYHDRNKLILEGTKVFVPYVLENKESKEKYFYKIRNFERRADVLFQDDPQKIESF